MADQVELCVAVDLASLISQGAKRSSHSPLTTLRSCVPVPLLFVDTSVTSRLSCAMRP